MLLILLKFKVLRGPVRYAVLIGWSIEKRNISYRRRNKRSNLNNPYLKDGDLIIGTSILSNTTEFIKEVTSPFVGLYLLIILIQFLIRTNG